MGTHANNVMLPMTAMTQINLFTNKQLGMQIRRQVEVFELIYVMTTILGTCNDVRSCKCYQITTLLIEHKLIAFNHHQLAGIHLSLII